jgi:hypothetical protein
MPHLRAGQSVAGTLRRKAAYRFRTMTRRLLHLSASTGIGHDDMTARVAEAISRSGAVLVDFSIFANLSATMRVELPSRQVGTLGRCLGATGLTLDPPSQRSVASWNDSGDVVATLKITFLGGAAKRQAEALAAGG